MSLNIPEPDLNALAVSEKLAARIRDELIKEGGWLSFDRYMDRVLYEPGLGYYSAGSVKFGPSGDFITAPEISPLLGRALARQLLPMLAQLTVPVILEIGAGGGRLAASILTALSDHISVS